MNAEIRRKLEMGIRALEFSRAHPDGSAGYTIAVERLERDVSRAQELATQQRAGIIATQAATSRKRDLRGMLQHTLLRHLGRVAASASTDQPELVRRFAFPKANASYQAFRTAARAMAGEAVGQRALLVQHGLVEPLLDRITQTLDQLDQAMQDSVTGRLTHIGAGAELEVVVKDLLQVVDVLDGLNRFRFAADAQKLAAWESASNVLGPVRSNGGETGAGEGEKPTDDQVKPAA